MVFYDATVTVTERKLTEFRTWMLERGRTGGTAELYALNVRSCVGDPGGVTARLVSGDLAPNTARANLAALRAWAAFNDDGKLTKRLSDIRLPPARRIRVKIPLEMPDLKRLVRHLRDRRMRNEAMRQVLLIMALRGLRSGDVLRIRRPDAVRALASGKLVYEGKGRKRIEIAVAPIREQIQALADMEDWSKVSDLISTSERQKTLSKKIWRAAKRIAKEIGMVDVYPHRLRRTFATEYLRKLKGDSNALVKLKQYMQWESLSTAERYVDAVSQDELDEIAAGLVGGILD